MKVKTNQYWCDLDPNRVWRAPTPKIPEDSMNSGIQDNGKPDPSLMMRLTHNTSYISLSALENQPSGSSAVIYPPLRSQLRPEAPPLEEQLQNVSVSDYNDYNDFASLGITAVNSNPWYPIGTKTQSMSFSTASTNGFTGSDTSSAPMSPISSPGLKKNGLHVNNNGYHQQTTQKTFYKNPAHPNNFRNNNRVNGTGGQQHHGFQPHYQNTCKPNGFNNGVHCQQNTVTSPVGKTLRDEHKPGMRDLGYWLKKLRLHKYAPLFQDMTYRQLLNLNNAVLEKMRVTNGARKKIAQSIEKLHERPGLLKSIEQKLKNGNQCIRCAICSIRQLLWSPFIKYDGGNRKTSPEIIDGFNVPSQMISDENLPALIFRCVEILHNLVFPLRQGGLDLEDEYQLTMFHMYESIMKNEAFTQNQQRRAFCMKKTARLYANPEEIRRHRMGMVSSSQCEGCHHAEVVTRERLMEFQDRQFRQARGDFVGLPTLSSCTAVLDMVSQNPLNRNEFNIPPASTAQRVQMRVALMEIDEWVDPNETPKAAEADVTLPSEAMDQLVLPTQMKSSHFWSNVNDIWGQAGNKPSTSFRLPMYPSEMETSENVESVSGNDAETFDFLNIVPDEETPKASSLSEFNFPESLASSKKANSTGSGYSSSDSDTSIIGTEEVTTTPKTFGLNQILYPSLDLHLL